MVRSLQHVIKTLRSHETEQFFRKRVKRTDVSKALKILRKAGKGNSPIPGDETT